MNKMKRKGFTLIELVVVIAIMAILALITVPNLMAYLDRAKTAKIDANMKNIHTAAEMVRQTERGLDTEKVKIYSNIENLEKNKNPVELTYTVFENEDKQVIVQYKDNKGKIHTFPKEFGNLSGGNFEWVPGWGYTATNEEGIGYYKYIGSETTVKIPHEINGHPMTSYYMMFHETSVTKVISDNPNVTDMNSMFTSSQATTLDLSSFDTSNVTYMSFMFSDSQATTILGINKFDTSKVTDMSGMFLYSQATTLDLSSFDTSNVTNMNNMFSESSATTLDLSSFDTSKVTIMSYMFCDSQATTGYARTSEDADRFNNSSDKPAGLTFIVK